MEAAVSIGNYHKITVKNGEEILSHKMTYREYKNIPDDIRCELINGIIYLMSSPDEEHQWISQELSFQLQSQLRGTKCTLYSEFDVRLFYQEDESDVTTVRPDIIVVCDETKVFRKKNCEGAPDFVIEILSESSTRRDFEYKKSEYEKAGVKEYWIICKGTVHKFLLDNNEYAEYSLPLKEFSRLEISSLEGCYLDFLPIIERYNWR